MKDEAERHRRIQSVQVQGQQLLNTAAAHMVSVQHTTIVAGRDEVETDWKLLLEVLKTECDNDRAACCIHSNCLGSPPWFDGKEFQLMFRLGRWQFQRLMNGVGNLQDCRTPSAQKQWAVLARSEHHSKPNSCFR